MSTNQFRRYLDLLNEADLVPPNTNVALPSSGTFSNDQAIANLNRQMSGEAEPRCAVCGTPQNQHQQLQHQFVAGGADRPGSVGSVSGDVGRIKQLQAELKAAGANLGATGANRDGIDGDLGPLTTAAMAKYPQIAAKYADLSRAPAQAATPAVDTSKLNSALSAIESIVAKYKGKSKVSESQIYEADRPLSAKEYQARIAQNIPPDITEPAPGFQQSKIQKGGYVPASATPTQSVYDRFKPSPSGAPMGPAKAVELAPKGWASKVGSKILSKLPGFAARTAARAGTGVAATAASGPLAPAIGTALGIAGTAYTIYDLGKMLYDAYKDSKNLEGMNDADQAVVKQNLAVVNSFMKDPNIANTLPPDIQARVENVYTDLHNLAVDTGYNTPAATPAGAPTQAATPAAKAVPDVKSTVDQLDKLLKKNKFESREPRSLSEQMARDRDIVNEGLGSTAVKGAAWLGKNVIAPSAKYVGGGIASNIIAPATKLATQAATAGGIGYGGWKAFQTLTAPKTMSAEDKAEFTRLLADYKKMVPDQATFDALPPDVQEKLIDIANRVQQMEQQPQGN